MIINKRKQKWSLPEWQVGIIQRATGHKERQNGQSYHKIQQGRQDNQTSKRAEQMG